MSSRGLLIVPQDLKPASAGRGGLPARPGRCSGGRAGSGANHQAYRYYKAFAARLAERGYVVLPRTIRIAARIFRVLQRKANPLENPSLNHIAQHDRILEWLSELPFVDAKRIGFYGLSYGGKTAMRVPAVLERYALSICSGTSTSG